MANAPTDDLAPKDTLTRRSNRSGQASRDHIIAMTERLLREIGYHQLSTRKVADACGISVGNLTYHFPSKILLIEEVMLEVCDRYAEIRPAVSPNSADDPIGELRHLLTWMIGDAVAPETSGLFLEFWLLAKHHGFGTEIIERSYGLAVDWLVDVLKRLFPSAREKEYHQAAYFILTLSEGTIPVFSRPHSRTVEPLDMINPALSAVLSIIVEPRNGMRS